MNKQAILKKSWQAVLLAALLFLSGCIQNSTVKSEYYVLNPQHQLQALTPVQDDSISLEILSLDIPPYLDRKQIVTRASNEQLHFSESHRWAGKLRKNLERVLTRNLSLLLNSNNIWMRPTAIAAQSRYKLQISVLHFEYDGSQTINLAAQWQLTRKDTDKVIAAEIVDLSTPIQRGEPHQLYRHITLAMSQSFAELSAVIARQILADAQP